MRIISILTRSWVAAALAIKIKMTYRPRWRFKVAWKRSGTWTSLFGLLHWPWAILPSTQSSTRSSPTTSATFQTRSGCDRWARSWSARFSTSGGCTRSCGSSGRTRLDAYEFAAIRGSEDHSCTKRLKSLTTQSWGKHTIRLTQIMKRARMRTTMVRSLSRLWSR